MKQLLRLLTAVIAMLLVTGFAFANEPRPEKKEKVKKGWLGVSIQDVNEKAAKKNKLSSEEGAYVNEVVDESPADSAGIKEGDIIVKFADRDVYDADDLVRTVAKTAPGTKVNISLLRDGEKKSISVVVGKERTARATAFTVGSLPRAFSFTVGSPLGLRLTSLNEQLAEYFGAPDKHGVLVEEVAEERAGAKAGFKAGDVITRAGKRTVEDVDDVQKELRKHDEGDKVEFEVLRKGTKKSLTAEIEEEENSQLMNVLPRVHPNVRMFRTPKPSEFEFNFNGGDEPWREAMRFKVDADRFRQEMNQGRESLQQSLRSKLQRIQRRNDI